MEKLIGINPVTEALKNKKEIEHIEIFKGTNEEKVREIKSLASKLNIKIKKTDKREDNSQGVVAYINDYDYYMDFGAFQEKIVAEEKSLILVLDGVQDPRNFGALIRSAETFGVSGIIIPERRSVRINETVIKTSTGAIEHVPIVKVTNLGRALEKLKTLDCWVYGAEASGAKFYHKEKYPNKSVLVLGSEGFGIKQKVKEHCDILIKIPLKGKINSLNVSVAGGILLAEMSK
jgi:23S rRNA (guanosine2251-2'-O)-methyltransferase